LGPTICRFLWPSKVLWQWRSFSTKCNQIINMCWLQLAKRRVLIFFSLCATKKTTPWPRTKSFPKFWAMVKISSQFGPPQSLELLRAGKNLYFSSSHNTLPTQMDLFSARWASLILWLSMPLKFRPLTASLQPRKGDGLMKLPKPMLPPPFNPLLPQSL